VDYKSALKSVWKGKAVLFVGSGFSQGAQSIDSSDFPTGSALARLLCFQAGIKETSDLRQASSRYVKKLGQDPLIELLTNIFSAKSTSDAQKFISSAPWKGIYTTNYDNILERAAADSGKKLRPVELIDSPRHYKDNTNCVLHINGFIDSLTPETLNASFKLTSASYLTEKFKESPWSTIFSRQILSAHAVFFIGYSLYDLEIQEILYSDSSLREKTYFIEYPGLDSEDIELSDLNDFGSLLAIGTEQFSRDLLNAKSDDTVGSAEILVTGFREQITPDLSTEVVHRDADVFDLLLQGRLDEKYMWSREVGKSEYLFKRDAFQITDLNQEKIENYVVTSDLGNGKTVFAAQLAHEALKSGKRVFWLLDEDYDCYDDIESLCLLKEPLLIVIENFSRKMHLVEHFSLKRSDKIILVLTERSTIFEHIEEELYFSRKIISISKTLEIDLNKLSSNDVISVASYLEKYGLWGERARLSERQKYAFITDSCNNELHGVLLGILNSSQIRHKFSSLLDVCSAGHIHSKTIISAFVLKMLGISDPAPHTIAALSGSSAIFEPKFRTNSAVRQLFNTTRGTISPKSSVLAEFSLQNYSDTHALVNILISIANAVRNKAFGSEMYWKLYRDLASFKYIQRMLPEKGKRESLIAFYEGLKEVTVERENPHFWLQYAIARLTFPDPESLEKAKIYLETALGLAGKKMNYTVTDIETQYARYHLEYANNTELPADLAYTEFALAHQKLLMITSREKHKREPFRPIRLYEPFFKKYGNSLAMAKVQAVRDAAEEILQHIRFLPYRLANEKNVRAADAALKIVKSSAQTRINSLNSAIK